MELPETLEHCHAMIRELLEENAALRQSGDEFGHLAERLNSALREERRRAADRQYAAAPARPNIRLAPQGPADESGRWAMAAAGQRGADGPSAVHGQDVRMKSTPRGPRSFDSVA